MKKILSTFFLFQTMMSFGQCINLYVKEHYSGDPICVLTEGSKLEICEKPGTACYKGGTITGGNCTYYIQNVRLSGDIITYEFGMDECTPWFFAPKYGELIINSRSKNFGFSIDNSSAAYSYYNENEASKYREQQRINNEAKAKDREKEKLLKDQQTTIQINDALSKKEFFKATFLYQNLNTPNINLLNDINVHFQPLKKQLDLLYSEYSNEFQKQKEEYYKNTNEFIEKNKSDISEVLLNVDGEKSYLSLMQLTKDIDLKKKREELWNNTSYLYKFSGGIHKIIPIGINSIVLLGYRTNKFDKLELSLKYDPTIQGYYSALNLFKNDTLKAEGVILSKSDFKVKKYTKPYSEKLNALINQIYSEEGQSFISQNYPLLELPLDYNESIPIKSLNSMDYPGENQKNEKYDELKNKTNEFDKDIVKFAKEKKEIRSKNFYNPAMLYLLKKMYPNADTIVFLRGDYRKYLGSKAVHFPYRTESSNGEWEYASIMPIKKGSVEIKDDKLRVSLENGNYTEQEIYETIFPKSLISLKKVDIESLSLDSIFIRTKFNHATNEDYIDDIYSQYPLFYTQYQIGKEIEENWSKKWSVEYAKFKENESILIKILPIYETSEFYKRYGQSKVFGGLNNYVPSVKTLGFDFQREKTDSWSSEANTYQGADGNYKHKEDMIKVNKDFQKYIESFTDYLRYKNQGNSKKAIGKLEVADKYLDAFIKNYFNLKYYY